LATNLDHLLINPEFLVFKNRASQRQPSLVLDRSHIPEFTLDEFYLEKRVLHANCEIFRYHFAVKESSYELASFRRKIRLREDPLRMFEAGFYSSYISDVVGASIAPQSGSHSSMDPGSNEDASMPQPDLVNSFPKSLPKGPNSLLKLDE